MVTKLNTFDLNSVWLQSLLFSCFLIVTSCFNRLAVDDYYFIGELREASLKDVYAYLYNNWHGRWSSNFITLVLIQFHQVPFFLTTYNIISFVALYYAIFRLFRSINEFYLLGFSTSVIFPYSIVFVSVFFFCTISVNETWFWYTSSVIYFWSIILILFGINIFFTNRKKTIDILLYLLSCVYLGGSNEPLAIFSMLMLTFFVIKKKDTLFSSIGCILLLSSFLINYLSSGTQHRDEITPSLGIVDLILFTGYGSIKFLLFYVYKTFVPAILLAVPFYFLGKVSTARFRNNFQPKKSFIRNVLLIFSIVILNQLMVIYTLGGLAPDRSGITSSIVISFLICHFLFNLGGYHKKTPKPLKWIPIINIIFLLIINGFFFVIHQNYSSALDKRIKTIKESQSPEIHLSQLPYSGFLYSAEITKDPKNFKNQHLKKGLGISSEIKLDLNTDD